MIINTTGSTLCVCGCGRIANQGKWCRGHWNKGDDHPMHGKKHTEESKDKMSKGHKGQVAWNKGIPCSEEVKQKIKNKNMGKAPWNKGKKGVQVSHRKGKTGVFSEETLLKLSEKAKNRKVSEESRRKMSESRMGEKNHAWRGGTTFFPYCPKFNKQLKERIRNRDNRTCQLCNEKENRQRLDVHHINSDRINCSPQLISLCRRCHGRVTQKKNYYEALFMSKLKERGLLIE